MLVAASVWLLCVTGAAAQPRTAIPPGFHVPPIVAPVVTRLLETSATFRRQVDWIVEARIRVVIAVAAPWELPVGAVATATIGRVERSVTFVRIRLVLNAQLGHLLAHELEHVIEQLDGVDLRQLAKARDGRAWETARGSFETARAFAAGERVRAELRGRGAPTMMAHRVDPK